RSSKRSTRRAVRLVVGRLEDERHAQAAGDVHEPSRKVGGVLVALDDTRRGNEDERTSAAHRDVTQLDRGHRGHYMRAGWAGRAGWQDKKLSWNSLQPIPPLLPSYARNATSFALRST